MSEQQDVIDTYFRCMRRGADAESDLLALFTSDAVYEEPFSGMTEPAKGIDAIRARLQAGWTQPLPDLVLDVLSVEVVGDRATSRWECRSSAFPAPVHGTDVYEFREGRISALRVTIDRPDDT